MFSTPELTIAYIKKRAASAGGVLASLPPADAAAFLSEIPTRFAVQAAAQMNARSAALILRQMSVIAGSALLRDLDFANAASILRQVDPADRREYLAELPSRLRRDFDRALAYPPGTVGAHMTTAIAMLAETDTAAKALELHKQAERDPADVIFVVDDQKKLLGAATVANLVRRPAHAALADLLDPTCVALSAHARLDAIAGLEAWHDYDCLPVVTRRGDVIGAISRTALRRVDQDVSADDGESSMPSLAESMTGALTASVTGLIDLMTRPTGTAHISEGPHER